MRNDYSRTAEVMAALRALEQFQPAPRRIICDPHASEFLIRPSFKLLARSRWLASPTTRAVDVWAPGALEFLTIRARLSDEIASEMATNGLEQIALLGAGFDTISLRIKGALRNVTIFEVDHPATQAVKREVMVRIGAPGNLRFVAVDFERDDFVEELRRAGFAFGRHSLVVWMGVTYYLTAQAMTRALCQIHTLGGAGMRFVFDYMLKEVVDGASRNREALRKARIAAKLGEPWLFGLDPARVSDYLAAFNFKLLKDYDAEELHSRYCPERAKPMNYVRIVACERA
ncbi:MAG TPA: SAM-dependent methyltransferase [Blastocatellia bacterium]|nr:SAM-dependent methyltransferase [Blastocatellia bacterium]